ncbi:metal ABC transporter permease [Pseudoruegeria sp. SHC-113]|uniref:metal ABC transporter permease n=1 Tax=Pseudoruegeria sp. SHC-113 TaxID=2855439 RepID=UPI0021BA3BFC|nr:metal ABC transporter permease [Pseudoruegeria sp. SHC-113]MCT8162181.1 metal ABC transporter permease [Pseudoruegeria sp. SHC-113]
MEFELATALLPFRFPFMQNAFLIALIVSVPTALLSCFLVLKGWALMGDAISHAVLPGIVLAYVFGFPLLLGAFGAGMFTAVATGYLAGNSRVKQDTVMGVVFAGMFGLGIVLYVAVKPDSHLDHILFGNMLGVGSADLLQAGAISLLVAGVLALKWRDFLLHSFDPAQARASGLAVNALHYGLLALISLTVVATLTATGLILAVGLLIAPGATAFLLARRFSTMLWLSVLLCMGAMTSGVYISFHLDSAPAPTIVLVLTALFLLAFAYRQIQTRRSARRTV